MAKFKVMYRETTQGTLKQEFVKGHSEAILRADLEAKGYKVLMVSLEDRRPWRERFQNLTKIKVALPRFGVSAAELALLCEMFKALYGSGVQMLQIVQMTIEETSNPWLRRRLVVVYEHLRGGDSLARSMSDPRCLKAFPALMRETIHTGEENGALEESLKRLAATFKRMAETKQQMISAMMYPLFTLVLFFGVCATIAILIPNALNDFIGKEALDKIRGQLPGSIRLLFTIRENPIYLILPPSFFAGLVFLVALGMRYRPTRHALTLAQRRIPLIGSLLKTIALVRLLEILTANHESGIPISESLTLVRNSVGDALFEESLDRIRVDILTTGTGLSAAINKPDEEAVYPGLVRQMIRAGEESGHLADMLKPITTFYDNQASATLKRLLDMLTPTMIVLLGSVVGPVVMGVYKTLAVMQDAMVGGLGA